MQGMNPCIVTDPGHPVRVDLHASWIARCPVRSFTRSHYRHDGTCRCWPENAAERNIRAERRAVEEGHHAFVQPDGSILVVSDTHEGKRYRVTYADSGNGIRFECKPEGAHAFKDDHLDAIAEPGVAPCKHSALAARRLEREGLAVFLDVGVWVAIVRTPPPQTPDNPLEGLPR
jgi:hypothetical protein